MRQARGRPPFTGDDVSSVRKRQKTLERVRRFNDKRRQASQATLVHHKQGGVCVANHRAAPPADSTGECILTPNIHWQDSKHTHTGEQITQESKPEAEHSLKFVQPALVVSRQKLPSENHEETSRRCANQQTNPIESTVGIAHIENGMSVTRCTKDLSSTQKYLEDLVVSLTNMNNTRDVAWIRYMIENHCTQLIEIDVAALNLANKTVSQEALLHKLTRNFATHPKYHMGIDSVVATQIDEQGGYAIVHTVNIITGFVNGDSGLNQESIIAWYFVRTQENWLCARLEAIWGPGHFMWG